MVWKEGKCHVFGVKQLNGSERANAKYFDKVSTIYGVQ